MESRPLPLISVIITVYDCARYLAEAIDSVLRQTYRPVELVVVDDGSEDGSGELARRFLPALRYVYHLHEGMGAARNRGVALAQGTFLAFLDADDLFPLDRLARQMAAFMRDPALETVYGHVREFLSPDLDPAAAKRLRPAAERITGRLAGALLIKKAAFLRVGLFNTTLKVGIGMDWSARASEQKLKSLMLPEIVMERRLHRENNGLREKEWRNQYVLVLKAALDRRRAMK
ncbi:MAG: family 2 glycosyl transferase [Deltaproteobacteria bacterium RIFCSPLOWO2_12_FULL_60_19]|nr:MAG: family 2 glycosyl transferase [Deltaproteobacteria bacterium RIFCSPLOWO2_12_FULL_60_19]